MGAVASLLAWETHDANGNERSIVSQCLDPVGVCCQPAAFNLYDPGEHLVDNPVAEATAVADEEHDMDEPPTSPPTTQVAM